MHPVPLEGLLTVGGVCIAIAALSYRKNLLDKPGIASAVAAGLIIGVLGDPAWLFVLLVYLVSSFAATRYRYQKKKEMGVAEGRRGERSWQNVLANGAPPAFIAVLWGLWPEVLPEGASGLLFLTAIAVAAADTIASEIGVLSPNAFLITHPLRQVKPGTDGGVSLLGTLASLFAASYVAAVGYITFVPLAPATLAVPPCLLVVPILFGFLGCQFDSLLGATLERRGWLGKGAVNFVSISAMTLAAWAVLALVP